MCSCFRTAVSTQELACRKMSPSASSTSLARHWSQWQTSLQLLYSTVHVNVVILISLFSDLSFFAAYRPTQLSSVSLLFSLRLFAAIFAWVYHVQVCTTKTDYTAKTSILLFTQFSTFHLRLQVTCDLLVSFIRCARHTSLPRRRSLN